MRAFWLFVDNNALLLMLLAIGTPLILTALGVRHDRRRRSENEIDHLGLFGCGGLLFGGSLGLVLLLMTMCGPPSGAGVTAEAWYRKTAPIITALERYHLRHGYYPPKLDSLIPNYLSADQIPKEKFEVWDALEYQHDSGAFRLIFRYSGHGWTKCTFNSVDRGWKCYGAF
jgi:hypothetical protein